MLFVPKRINFCTNHEELFYSEVRNITMDFTRDYKAVSDNTVSGTCLRRIQGGATHFTYSNNILNNADDPSFTNEYIAPVSRLANVKTDMHSYKTVQTPLEHQKYESLYMRLSSELPTSHQLTKMSLVFNTNEYQVFNTNGVHGGGVFAYQALVGDVLDVKADSMQSFYRIMEIEPFECTLNDAVTCINDLLWLDSITDYNHASLFLLSPNMVFKLTYLLLNHLSDHYVRSGFSFFIEHELNSVRFSELLNISEGSNDNNVSRGHTDMSGNILNEYPLIENGGIINTLSWSKKEKRNAPCQYRANYHMPPIERALKVSVAGGTNTLKSILQDNKIFLINDMHGFDESFNHKTFDFEGDALGVLFRSGKPQTKVKTRLKMNLIDIFRNILTLSSERNYGGDGCILAPYMLTHL